MMQFQVLVLHGLNKVIFQWPTKDFKNDNVEGASSNRETKSYCYLKAWNYFL